MLTTIRRESMQRNGSEIHFADTQYGFEYGAAKITRACSDKKAGWVMLVLETPKRNSELQIYVTKTGKVRISDNNGEWTRPTKYKG